MSIEDQVDIVGKLTAAAERLGAPGQPLTGSELSRAWREEIAAGRDPLSTLAIASDKSGVTVSPADARRFELQTIIAAHLAAAMITQRAGATPITAAEAVALYREVLYELRSKNASV